MKKKGLMLFMVLLMMAGLTTATTVFVDNGDCIPQLAFDDLGTGGTLSIQSLTGDPVRCYTEAIVNYDDVTIEIGGNVTVDREIVGEAINTFIALGDNFTITGEGKVINTSGTGVPIYIDGEDALVSVDVGDAPSGVWLENGASATLRDMSISDCVEYGIFAEDNSILITDVVDIHDCHMPVYAARYGEAWLRNSSFIGTGFRAVQLDQCDKAQVFNCYFRNDSIGIVADGVDSLHVTWCQFDDIVINGIWIGESYHNSIHNNDFNRCHNSIWLYMDGDEAIYNNVFWDCQVGIGSQFVDTLRIDYLTHNQYYSCEDPLWQVIGGNTAADTTSSIGPGVVRYPGPLRETTRGIGGGTGNWWDFQSPEAVVEQVAQVKPQKISINVYPNPFNSACNFSFMGDVNIPVKIVDVNGNHIADVEAGSRWIPSSDTPSGMYFFIVQNGREEYIAGKAMYLK